jgi:hypothetical protein
MWSIPANRRSITAIGIKALNTVFNRLDRHTGVTRSTKVSDKTSERQRKKKAPKMKKFGFATMIASGLAAAVLGFAGPAQADTIHHGWVYDIQPQVSVPHVDTSVHQSH